VIKRAGGTPQCRNRAQLPSPALFHFRFALLCLVAAVWCFASSASPVKIELPPETDSFKPAPGVELANGQCLSCHSVEYVVTQPPSPRTFWATSVKKMREKYGAAVAEEQIEPLLDYLTKHYGIDGTNRAASAATFSKPVTLTAPGTPISGAAVATNYWCLSCHDISAKKVGPPYKDIAAKYRNDAEAYAKIAEQVQKGGSGKWGPVMMPPFPMVSEAETKAVAEWILSQK
jgi:cytochrome c551/c552